MTARRQRPVWSVMLIAASTLWVWAAQATAGEPPDRTPWQGDPLGAARLDQMTRCGLWLDSLDRCASTFAAGIRVEGQPLPDDPMHTDWEGLRRDTSYFLGLQFAIIGVLYVLPESISSWSKEDKEEYSFDKWWHNVTHPKWDEDDLFINYVLHPYWGATYYVRGRERGLDPRGAFWFSVLLSSLYEFGAEALFEPVSIQDFFVTPIVGSLIGGYFMDWRDQTFARIHDAGHARFRDKALLVATDPLGAIGEQLDRLFVRDVEVRVRPFAQTLRAPGYDAAGGTPGEPLGEAYGLQVELRF